ncbi:MAG: hypothetical protein EOP10_01875 [Proteobacteria bacterium]|nr:MAG: hypothetical protein EOP10_01875 [Pseudomonadota bacterium]
MKKTLPLLVILSGISVLSIFYFKSSHSVALKDAQSVEFSAAELNERHKSKDLPKLVDRKAPEAETPKADNLPKLEEILAAQHKKIQTVELAREEIRRNPHESPPSLIEAASALSFISSLDEREPGSKVKIDAFYKECSHDGKTLTIARAFCLKKLVERQALQGDELAQVMNGMPDAVKNHYKKMEIPLF